MTGAVTIENTSALALHGGAGAVTGRDYETVEEHMRALIVDGGERLRDGAVALDIVEQIVAAMEASGLYVAGRGSAPNSAGYVEVDASIMDGRTRAAGAVASVRDIVYPVRLARRVMEATPHVMLSGAGALSFARAEGVEVVDDPKRYYVLPAGVDSDEVDDLAHGTVGAVGLDRSGHLAAATSTGGTSGKLEGRVGDSPLIGAGTWADDDIAISCTGTGEHIIRAGGAISIACNVKAGATLDDSIDAMLAEVERLGGDGGVIAVTRSGEISMRYNSAGMKRAAIGADAVPRVATFSD